jgi:hypothetical protein
MGQTIQFAIVRAGAFGSPYINSLQALSGVRRYGVTPCIRFAFPAEQVNVFARVIEPDDFYGLCRRMRRAGVKPCHLDVAR